MFYNVLQTLSSLRLLRTCQTSQHLTISTISTRSVYRRWHPIRPSGRPRVKAGTAWTAAGYLDDGMIERHGRWLGPCTKGMIWIWIDKMIFYDILGLYTFIIIYHVYPKLANNHLVGKIALCQQHLDFVNNDHVEIFRGESTSDQLQ